jgi:hypothetical protein
MSLRRAPDGTIVLHGSCPLDEAEPLHRMLISDRSADVDWTQCSYLHSVVLQLLMASRRSTTGPCGDPFVERWLSDKSL